MAAPPRSLADVMLEVDMARSGASPYSSWGSIQPVTNPVSDMSGIMPPSRRTADANPDGFPGNWSSGLGASTLRRWHPDPPRSPPVQPSPVRRSSALWRTQAGAPEAERRGIMSPLAPGFSAARAGEGGYMATLRGTAPIGAEAAAAGGKFLNVASGSALASEAGLAKTLAGVGKGALGPALAGMAVAPVLKAGGGALMGGEDNAGWDKYDAGQGLTGAGEALPVSAGLGGAAVALGASGPVGWGIAGLGALGYGIYSMFANDDDKSVVKRESATVPNTSTTSRRSTAT